MRHHRAVAALGLFVTISTSLTLAPHARAAVVLPTPLKIWDMFPRNTQGENGIFLQRRDLGTSNYEDLVNSADYQWSTPGTNFEIPIIFQDVNPLIFAHPSSVNGTGFDRDTAMSIELDGDAFSAIHLTGHTTTGAAPTVGFYIYMGANNYNAPIFQSGPFADIDLIIPYTPGDRLYFSTTAIGTDVDAWAKWDDLQIVGVPEPASAMLTVAAGLLLARRAPRRRRDY